MSFEEELQAALIGDEPDFRGTPSADTLALDSDQATRWMAQLDSIRCKRTEITAARDAAVARLDKLTNARKATLAEQEAWIEEALAIFHQVMLANDPEGAMTIVLPTGVLKSGTWGGDVWTYEDEDKFEAWVMDRLPGAVDYPAPKVQKGVAKKLIQEGTLRISDDVVVLTDGSTVPGLKVTKRERSFKAVDNTTIEIEAAKKAAEKAAKA